MNMKIYGDRTSGNCQKVHFTADYLGLPYEWVDVDIMKGEVADARISRPQPGRPGPRRRL